MLLVNLSMKEDLLTPKFIILFIEMHLVSKIKDLELNCLLLVLKSLIFWPLMLEEEKLVFLEVPESEKLS
jgi:hypothetical protein